MNLLQDIITYVRRIIKSPSNAVISDNLIIDYINRFWIMDVDARLQLFDLKTKYQFQTQPAVDQYNMPLYQIQTQPGAQNIANYPVYQGFIGPAYINGVQVPLHTQKNQFQNIWPNIVQNVGMIGTGNNTAGPYTLQVPIIGPPSPPNPPWNALSRGHIDITGIIDFATVSGEYIDPPLVDSLTAQRSIPGVRVTSVESKFYLTAQATNNQNVIVADSGQFLEDDINYGLLMAPGSAPGGLDFNGNPVGEGNTVLPGGYSITSNTINYLTGEIVVTFPEVIPTGNNISCQCYYFQSGLPRGILYYNNSLLLRSVPDRQYLVELDAYLSPAAFLNTGAAIPFGYMSEYIARGAARKMLADTGDWEQFDRYEPLFIEQERLVWKRSQRTWTSTRTETLYSHGFGSGFNNYGGGTTL